MVTTTDRKDRLRVAFPIRLDRADQDEHIIVCYLQLRQRGALSEVDIEYAYTLARTKSSSLTAVDRAIPFQMPLNKTFQSQIRAGVMLEFWDCIARDAQILAMNESDAIQLALSELKDLTKEIV